MLSLNRAHYFDLDEKTPDCVVLEVLKTCGKKVEPDVYLSKKNQVLDFIEGFHQDTSKKNPNVSLLATFTSPEVQKWTPYGLWSAFHHLIEFFKKQDFSDCIRKFSEEEIGPKTEKNPRSFDKTMIFLILQKNGIEYDCSDTLETMLSKIYDKTVKKKDMWTQTEPVVEIPEPVVEIPEPVVEIPEPVVEIPEDFSEEICIQDIINNIKHQDPKTLFKIKHLIQSPKVFDLNHFSKDDFVEKTKKMNLYGTVYNSCLSDLEAVMYGVKFFSIDFSKSSRPSVEVKNFCRAHLENKKYIPLLDDDFKEIWARNRDMVSTDKTWNKNLSHIYSSKTVTALIKYNGGEEQDDTSFFEKIKKDSTFYEGIMEGETVLSFFENKTLTDKDSVISYGKHSDFIYFTPSEIGEFLETQKDFSCFRDKNKQLKIHSVKKLLNICKENSGENDYNLLLEKIKFFMNKGEPNFPTLNSLMSRYLLNSDEIESILKVIYHFSSSDYTMDVIEEKTDRVLREINSCKPENKDLIGELPLLEKSDSRLYRHPSEEKIYETVEKCKLHENYRDKKEILKNSISYYFEKLTTEKITQ